MSVHLINAKMPRPIPRPKPLMAYRTQPKGLDDPILYHVSSDVCVIADEKNTIEIELHGLVTDKLDICDLPETYSVAGLVVDGIGYGFIPVSVRKATGVIDHTAIGHLVRLAVRHSNPDLSNYPIDIQIGNGVVYDHPTVELFTVGI